MSEISVEVSLNNICCPCAGIHPHELNIIVIVKLKPGKVPMPATKRDGRKEVKV
jgi:hypothetical protein